MELLRLSYFVFLLYSVVALFMGGYLISVYPNVSVLIVCFPGGNLIIYSFYHSSLGRNFADLQKQNSLNLSLFFTLLLSKLGMGGYHAHSRDYLPSAIILISVLLSSFLEPTERGAV